MPGSLVLVGGDPGIGKSTLLLQVCRKLSKDQRSVLYISGKNLRQIKMRAKRIGEFNENLKLLCETNLGTIKAVIEEMRPDVVTNDLFKPCMMRRSLPHREAYLRCGNLQTS